MKKLITILAILVLVTSCGPVDHHRHTKKIHKVKCYKEKSTIVDADPGNDFIFWYLMELDGGSYNYYSSSSPVANLKTINWVSSQTLPPQLANEKTEKMEELEQQETETDNEAEAGESDSDGNGATDAGSDGDGGDGGGDGGGD